MKFLSDNGGNTYNMCHCEWTKSCSEWAGINRHGQSHVQFGVTSRSQTWNSGGARRTASSSTTSSRRAGSTTRYVSAFNPHCLISARGACSLRHPLSTPFATTIKPCLLFTYNHTTAQPHNHPFILIDADGSLTHSNSVGATHPSTASAPRSSRARTRSTSSTTSGTSTRPSRTVRAAPRYGARRTAHARSLAASVSLECFGSSVFNDVLTNLGLFAPWGL